MNKKFDIYGAFPKVAKVDKIIDKTAFYKNNRMTKSGKDNFLLFCESASIKYSLSEATTGIKPIVTNDMDYTEIQVLEIKIKTKFFGWKDIANFIKVICKTIPYPLVVVLNYHDTGYRLAIGQYHKRKDGVGLIADTFRTSAWIDTADVQIIDFLLMDLLKKAFEKGTMQECFEYMYEQLKFHTNSENRNFFSNDTDKYLSIIDKLEKESKEIEKTYADAFGIGAD